MQRSVPSGRRRTYTGLLSMRWIAAFFASGGCGRLFLTTRGMWLRFRHWGQANGIKPSLCLDVHALLRCACLCLDICVSCLGLNYKTTRGATT